MRGQHAELIRQLGAAGTVLLKNFNETLPLKNLKNVGVFGNDAVALVDGFPSHNFTSYDIGTLYGGGGSGAVRVEDPVAPLDAIKARA